MSDLSAVLHGVGDLRMEERAVLEPAPHEALVKAGAVGICGSEVHYYINGRIGEYVVDQPMVIGHEPAGVIVAVGSAVDPSRVGELVALEPGVPDRTCKECLAGRYDLCRNVVSFATPPVDGSIAQFVAIDASFAHRAPAGATPESENWFT